MTIGFEEISFSNVCLILKALEEICDLGEGKLKKIFKFPADSLYSWGWKDEVRGDFFFFLNENTWKILFSWEK